MPEPCARHPKFSPAAMDTLTKTKKSLNLTIYTTARNMTHIFIFDNISVP